MDSGNYLIESFADFAGQKNIDRPTMIRILEDVFRTMIRRKYKVDDNFDIIINAAKKLENEKIKFIIRGKGKLLPYIEDLIKKLQVKNMAALITLSIKLNLIDLKHIS